MPEKTLEPEEHEEQNDGRTEQPEQPEAQPAEVDEAPGPEMAAADAAEEPRDDAHAEAEAPREPEAAEAAAADAAEEPRDDAHAEAEAPREPEAAEAPEPAGGEEGEEQEEEKGPDFGVAVEDVGTLRKKVTVTVPASLIDAKRNEMFGELSTSAQVPGFRIGRAPRRLIEKRFGREVGRDVRNALIGESLGAVLEKSELKVLGEPDLDLEAIELPDSGDMTYELEVEVAPEFTLPELKGIPVRKASEEVSDERVDEAIDRLRLGQARYEATDGAAAEQDIVDVSAKVSGEGIDELTRPATLRVAPGQIEGLPMVELGKELAGKKVGETVTLTVRVPEVHPNEDWRGKEATIELTIGGIRKRILPEIDEEYAKERGYDSLAELRKEIGARMGARLEIESRRAMRDQVHQYLLAETDFELPEGVATRHAARVLQRRYVDLMQRGIAPEQIEERMTEIQASVVEEAQRELKLDFILQKIADEQKIEVTEEELNARVAQMATFQERRPEKLRQELESDGTLAQVRVSLREEKAVQRLLEDAKVTEEGAEADEEPQAEAEPADEPQPEAEPADEPQPEAEPADEQQAGNEPNEDDKQ